MTESRNFALYQIGNYRVACNKASEPLYQAVPKRYDTHTNPQDLESIQSIPGLDYYELIGYSEDGKVESWKVFVDPNKFEMVRDLGKESEDHWSVIVSKNGYPLAQVTSLSEAMERLPKGIVRKEHLAFLVQEPWEQRKLDQEDTYQVTVYLKGEKKPFDVLEFYSLTPQHCNPNRLMLVQDETSMVPRPYVLLSMDHRQIMAKPFHEADQPGWDALLKGGFIHPMSLVRYGEQQVGLHVFGGDLGLKPTFLEAMTLWYLQQLPKEEEFISFVVWQDDDAIHEAKTWQSFLEFLPEGYHAR